MFSGQDCQQKSNTRSPKKQKQEPPVGFSATEPKKGPGVLFGGKGISPAQPKLPPAHLPPPACPPPTGARCAPLASTRRPDFEQRLSAIAGKVAAVQFHPTPALSQTTPHLCVGSRRDPAFQGSQSSKQYYHQRSPHYSLM